MRAAKVDSTHSQVVAALRDVGASVTSLAAVGWGVPDLVVGWRKQNYLLEVKNEKGKLNPYQKAFHAMWNGQVCVVRTPDEALAAIGAIPSMPCCEYALEVWNVGKIHILHTPTPGQDLTRSLFPLAEVSR